MINKKNFVFWGKNGEALVPNGFILIKKGGRSIPLWVKLGRVDDELVIDEKLKDVPVGTKIYSGHYPDDYYTAGMRIGEGPEDFIRYEFDKVLLINQLEDIIRSLSQTPEIYDDESAIVLKELIDDYSKATNIFNSKIKKIAIKNS